MNKEDYNRATALLEQVEKIEVLQKKVQTKYDAYKKKDNELCQVLNSCYEALDVLKTIDLLKFKEL